MLEDFYPTTNQPTNITPGIVQTPTVATTEITTNLNALNLDLIISYLNSFILAWCIFYTLFYLSSYYYYYIKFPDREVERMKNGLKSFQSGAFLWYSYFICLIPFGIYIFVSGGIEKGFFGVLTIICFLVKVLFFDLPRIDYIGESISKFYKSAGEAISSFIENLINLVLNSVSPRDKKEDSKK
jgi:hypothetical protein